jgi:hypothetical protein
MNFILDLSFNTINILLLETDLLYVRLSLHRKLRVLGKNVFYILSITHTSIYNSDFSKKFNNFPSSKYTTFHYHILNMFIISVYN